MAANKSKTPMYEVIAKTLTREIHASRRPAHELFVTLQDICDRFSTSKITAQRAIQEMANRGVVYTKRGSGAHIAQQGDRRQSKLIGFLFNVIVDDGALPIVINGAEALARQLNYNLILGNAQGDLRLGQEYATRLLAQGVDGILLDIPQDEEQQGPLHSLIHRFEAERIPVVLVQKRFLDENESMAYVVTDNYGGTFKVIEHLCGLGHRRIAGIFETTNSGAIERLEGYKGAILTHGLVFVDHLVQSIRELEDCSEAIDNLLRLRQPPTAIFCIHDLVARHVVQILQERGIRVPEDMAIVGFDDLPFSRYLTPKLTTVRQPLEQMGRESMRILYHRMEKDYDYYPHLRLETELVIRESCGTQIRAVGSQNS